MNGSNKNSTFIRSPFFSIIIGLVVTIVLSIVSLKYDASASSIAVVLLSAIVGYLVSFTWEVFTHFKKQDNIDQKLNELNKLEEQQIAHQDFENSHFKELREKQDEINRMLKEQITYHKTLEKSIIPKQFHPFFEKREGIDSDIVKKILPKYIEDFIYNQQELSVKGEYWAISCYKELWENLVLRQKANPEKQIHVKAVDISYEKIKQERGYDIKKLIELQSKFLESGGKITRIFIGLDESKDRINDVFNGLFKYKEDDKGKTPFKAYFINNKDINDNYFSTNDFLLVNDVCSCQWSYDGKNVKTPNNVTIYVGNNDAISDRWNQLHYQVDNDKTSRLN